MPIVSHLEIWKDVVSYEGLYQVSNLGRVKSLERNIVTSNGKNMTRKEKILRPSNNNRGYMQVRFYVNGNFPCLKVHRLVAEAFLFEFDDGKQINHINGDKSDNRVENLECVDQMKNMEHRATVLNNKPRGVRKHHSKWKAQTTIKGIPHCFGYFNTKKEAYNAFFEGFKHLRGCEPWDLNEFKTH